MSNFPQGDNAPMSVGVDIDGTETIELHAQSTHRLYYKISDLASYISDFHSDVKAMPRGHFLVTPNATATGVLDHRCTSGSVILTSPKPLSIVPGNGSFTVHHDSSPKQDQIFNYVIL